MSSYPTPSTSNSSVFNTKDFNSAYDNINYFTGDKRYLKASGFSLTSITSNIANIQSANTTIFNLLSSSGTAGVQELQNANINTYNLLSGLTTGNTATNTRITALETGNTATNTRITALETGNTNSNTRITGLQTSNTVAFSSITGLQTSNTVAFSSITGLQTSNTVAFSSISALINANTATQTRITTLESSDTALVNANVATQTRISNLETGNTATNVAISALQAGNTATNARVSLITTSSGNTNVSGGLVVSGNIISGNNFFNVANGSAMINTINPTSTGTSCPLLVQSTTGTNNPWLNGICCYGNLTANAVISTSVQNTSGFHCWYALANRFGNSWVIANDNSTNSGNPLRWQASQDFSNASANQMSLSRNGNLWVNRAIGIGNVSPIAPLYVTAGGSGTDPSTNGLLVANMNASSGNNAIITARTNSASGGSPMVSLDVFNVAGWSILNSNSLSNSLNFNANWDGSGTNHLTILRGTGNVGVATTNPAHRCTVGGTFGIFPTGNFTTERLRVYTDATGTSDIIQIRQTIGSSSTYWFYNGNNTAGTVSDRRVKTNIANLNVDDSIAFIKNLIPRKFNYLSNPDGDAVVGFIAQEVLNCCVSVEQKSTVSKHETYNDNDPNCEHMGLSHTQLLPMLIQTVQNLLSKIDDLENRISELELK